MDPLAAAFIAVEEHVDLLRGETGPQGEKGDQGPQGIRGPQGTHTVGRDGEPGAPGEPGLYWKGPWKRGTYQPGDAVELDGSSYVCTIRTTSKPPSKAWDLLAKKGRDGVDGMDRGGGSGSAPDRR